MKRSLRIVHMSDIHCGQEFNEKEFCKAVKEINILKPDVVIITGDLTDNGYLEEYELAKANIQKIQCKNLLICPGNHDYRHTGYILFNKFWPRSGKNRQLLEIGPFIIMMIGTALPDDNDGEAGYRQIGEIEKILDKYQNKFKIIGMHHHILPVPDTGMDRNTIIDDGDLLQCLVKSKVNLVLCGHRHRPWKWEFGGMEIIHAGTPSTSKFRGFFAHSYNIIEISEEKISTKIKIVGGEIISISKILEGTRAL